MNVFIVNPQSGGGKTGARLAQLRRQVRSVFGKLSEIRLTEYPNHATEIAASLAGAEMVVAVGGDGSANEVVNGLARIPVEQRPALGVLPAGTGCDLVKTLGMPSSLPEALRILRDGDRRSCDWMRMEVAGTERYCINVSGFGMAGAIVKVVNQSGKRFGGRASVALATARVALSWRAPHVEIEWDGPEGPGSWEGKMASTFLANGAYCGGGMWVGAGGSMSDGVVEMSIVPDQPLSTAARHMGRLYTGTIREAPGVVFARVRRVSARAPGSEVLVDVDGEQPGGLPLSMEVEPGVLSIVGSWVTPG